MISYSSCAELETIMNEAAIVAGTKRKEYIEMQDVVNAVLKKEYNMEPLELRQRVIDAIKSMGERYGISEV